MAQTVKHLPAMRETWVRSLGQEDPLEKAMATHSNTLAWKIPRSEEPGGHSPWGRRLSDVALTVTVPSPYIAPPLSLSPLVNTSLWSVSLFLFWKTSWYLTHTRPLLKHNKRFSRISPFSSTSHKSHKSYLPLTVHSTWEVSFTPQEKCSHHVLWKLCLIP